MADTNTTLNTDVYSVKEAIVEMKKEFMEDDDPDVLELGLFGFLSAQLAKQTSAVIKIAAETANEMFPTRARLESSIISHAISNNITELTATPATIPVLFCIIEQDLINLFNDQDSDTVVIDSDCKIMISDYEYHFDYPIEISRTVLTNNEAVYTASYDMSVKNKTSNIDNPYLPSPYIFKTNGDKYLYIACTISQVEITNIYENIVTSNEIENSTYEFTFSNQLSSFDIFITEGGVTTQITPLFESESTINIPNYCWYSYINEYTIRIKFDHDNYMPSINAEILTKVYTTHGSECNFTYSNTVLMVLEDTNKYSYLNIQTMVIPQGDSAGGVDRISVDELKRIIPKEASSRNNLTKTSDLNNYFNKFNTDNTIIKFVQKIDNQFMRIYYSYLLTKDSNGNVVPTNTIDMIIDPTNMQSYQSIDGNTIYYMKQGFCIGYKNSNGYGEYVSDTSAGNLSNYDFIYTTPYKMTIDSSIPKVSYYMSIMDELYSTYFDFINDNTPLQFICSKVKWNRPYSGDDSSKYIFSFTIMQNITENYNLIYNDGYGTIEERVKAVVVCYKDDVPYRYFNATLSSYNEDDYTYDYTVEMETTDAVDGENCIRINNGISVGTTTEDYGFFNQNTRVEIYILCEFIDNNETIKYGRSDLDNIVPSGISDFSVTNKYIVNDGIDFFINFSDAISSIATAVVSNGANAYKLQSVPVIKYSYASDESLLMEFIKTLKSKKDDIDEALDILENQFSIDFKFYNTYGKSMLYRPAATGITIDRVNISIKFNISLNKSSDTYTKDYIIRDIKNSVETLSRDPDYHIPNLISQITSTYGNSIYYIEFLGFNEYGPGFQHFYQVSSSSITDVPEFININMLEDGSPDITINLV